jgi:hypothetical protein
LPADEPLRFSSDDFSCNLTAISEDPKPVGTAAASPYRSSA